MNEMLEKLGQNAKDAETVLEIFPQMTKIKPWKLWQRLLSLIPMRF